jgi:hypothetical protein
MKTTMDICLTLFNSIFDNKTHRSMNLSSFDEFEQLLYNLSEVKRKDKKSAQLISPAYYVKDTTRANKNVVAWGGWAAVDVDSLNCTMETLQELMYNKITDWKFICYSTASSTIAQPKFRLVFELNKHIQADKIRHFWFALNTELESMGDIQTKDLSRMYYIPAKYDNSNNFIFKREGTSIDVDQLLLKHPFIEKKVGNTLFDSLPEEMQKKIIQHRKDQLENRSIRWTSYRDCPFVNKKLIAEYKTISDTGWYHKMYQLMVSISANAIKQEYPITVHEVVELCKELDLETGNWYSNRPLDKEAERALEFVYCNL